MPTFIRPKRVIVEEGPGGGGFLAVIAIVLVVVYLLVRKAIRAADHTVTPALATAGHVAAEAVPVVLAMAGSATVSVSALVIIAAVRRRAEARVQAAQLESSRGHRVIQGTALADPEPAPLALDAARPVATPHPRVTWPHIADGVDRDPAPVARKRAGQ